MPPLPASVSGRPRKLGPSGVRGRASVAAGPQHADAEIAEDGPGIQVGENTRRFPLSSAGRIYTTSTESVNSMVNDELNCQKFSDPGGVIDLVCVCVCVCVSSGLTCQTPRYVK